MATFNTVLTIVALLDLTCAGLKPQMLRENGLILAFTLLSAIWVPLVTWAGLRFFYAHPRAAYRMLVNSIPATVESATYTKTTPGRAVTSVAGAVDDLSTRTVASFGDTIDDLSAQTTYSEENIASMVWTAMFVLLVLLLCLCCLIDCMNGLNSLLQIMIAQRSEEQEHLDVSQPGIVQIDETPIELSQVQETGQETERPFQPPHVDVPGSWPSQQPSTPKRATNSTSGVHDLIRNQTKTPDAPGRSKISRRVEGEDEDLESPTPKASGGHRMYRRPNVESVDDDENQPEGGGENGNSPTTNAHKHDCLCDQCMYEVSPRSAKPGGKIEPKGGGKKGNSPTTKPHKHDCLCDQCLCEVSPTAKKPSGKIEPKALDQPNHPDEDLASPTKKLSVNLFKVPLTSGDDTPQSSTINLFEVPHTAGDDTSPSSPNKHFEVPEDDSPESSPSNHSHTETSGFRVPDVFGENTPEPSPSNNPFAGTILSPQATQPHHLNIENRGRGKGKKAADPHVQRNLDAARAESSSRTRSSTRMQEETRAPPTAESEQPREIAVPSQEATIRSPRSPVMVEDRPWRLKAKAHTRTSSEINPAATARYERGPCETTHTTRTSQQISNLAEMRHHQRGPSEATDQTRNSQPLPLEHPPAIRMEQSSLFQRPEEDRPWRLKAQSSGQTAEHGNGAQSKSPQTRKQETGAQIRSHDVRQVNGAQSSSHQSRGTRDGAQINASTEDLIRRPQGNWQFPPSGQTQQHVEEAQSTLHQTRLKSIASHNRPLASIEAESSFLKLMKQLPQTRNQETRAQTRSHQAREENGAQSTSHQAQENQDVAQINTRTGESGKLLSGANWQFPPSRQTQKPQSTPHQARKKATVAQKRSFQVPKFNFEAPESSSFERLKLELEKEKTNRYSLARKN